MGRDRDRAGHSKEEMLKKIGGETSRLRETD